MDLLKTAFVLHPDVLLIPVRDLPKSVTGPLACRKGDYAVTRLRGRTPSRIVDAQAAALLKRFLKPATILDTIVAHSKAAKLDAGRLLEDAYPLIELLRDSNMLVPRGSRRAKEVEPSLEPDQRVGGLRILRCIHLLDDTEVYHGSHPRRGLIALKIARSPSGISPALRREAAILRHLRGRVAPRLIATGTWRRRPFLATAWCPGESISDDAARLRNDHTEESHLALLDLCGRLLEAYATLHAAGVVHGDVHDHNVLSAPETPLRIVDYGFAWSVGWSRLRARPPRAGVGYFQDPQLVAAYAAGVSPPPLDVAAEQYSLGALVYLCLTGEHYLKFNPDVRLVYRQIAEEAPLPMISRGLRPSPHVEAVVRRALSKAPADRFPSVDAFARAFRRAAAADTPRRDAGKLRRGPSGATDRFVNELIDRLGPESALYQSRALPAPTASLTFGASGIAYALYRLACAARSPRLLAHADLWSDRAVRALGDDDAFDDSAELSRDVVGAVTPYHTAAGVHCVEVLLGHATGDVSRQQTGLERFLRASAAPCRNLDLTLGRSGVLLACSLLLENARTAPAPDTTRLLDFGRHTMGQLWRRSGMFEPHGRPSFAYLGIAHGWAGLLYATLRWCSISGDPLPAGVEPSLQHLAGYGERRGRGMCWPIAANDRAAGVMSGWCHGSAGYVHLWTEAHRSFGEPRFLDLAASAARNVWDEPMPVGHLCCGLAGQSYGLLALYTHTGEDIWLRRAHRLAHRAASVPSPPQCVNSLYKGDVGVGILLAELEHHEHRGMPFFGREA